MAKKTNKLANKVTAIALQQLQTSWEFKQPRISRLQDYRRLYNTQVLPKLRIQFNTPLPVFSGMIDTLSADLNDKLIIEYKNTDPADWKAVKKANAALQNEMESSHPNAQWEKKFRQYRFEKIITGRGIIKLTADNEKDFKTNLEVVPFEDFFFEPGGGGNLENHIFAGQQNIWKSKSKIKELAKKGEYDQKQVDKLLVDGGDDYKQAGIWDGDSDIGNRFAPLGLSSESHNYVGEEMFNLCEWVTEFRGIRWRIVFEPYTGIWLKFVKNEEVCSADFMPWMSSASHEDLKNFSSKSFADDLYPVADSIITLFNQDLTNRQKRNLNAKAYDRAMFKDVAKLDEAQYRPDALVPADTQNGTRRISEGIYAFETPEITGTIDVIDWLQKDTGRNLGVTQTQQGANQAASKRVGVVVTEMAQISKRLAYAAAPFIEIGQQLGERFFVAIKDYMKKPLAIKLLGENGVEWDLLKRVDLNVKRNFEITVSSATSNNNMADIDRAKKDRAFELTAESPNINQKMRTEYILKEIGGFSDQDAAVLLDVTNETDKETMDEVSSVIQSIYMHGKKPKLNHNADRYFVNRLFEFAKKHRDTLSPKKFKMFMECFEQHLPIAMTNAKQSVDKELQPLRKATNQAQVDPNQQPIQV